MIEVVNLRSLKNQNPGWISDDAYVYIGRGSMYGNPFKIGPDGNRDMVIDKYAEYAVTVLYIRNVIERMFFADKNLFAIALLNVATVIFLRHGKSLISTK